eukprot:m51a1_g5726 hypothetical protein (196) ;mRNA; r:1121534-1122121
MGSRDAKVVAEALRRAQMEYQTIESLQRDLFPQGSDQVAGSAASAAEDLFGQDVPVDLLGQERDPDVYFRQCQELSDTLPKSPGVLRRNAGMLHMYTYNGGDVIDGFRVEFDQSSQAAEALQSLRRSLRGIRFLHLLPESGGSPVAMGESSLFSEMLGSCSNLQILRLDCADFGDYSFLESLNKLIELSVTRCQR